MSFAYNKIINNKWVIENNISEGCCGIVLKVYDITDKKRKAAVKVY